MKSRPIAVLFSGLVVAILVWMFAFRNASWAAPITEPLFILGTLVEFALTPARTRTPDLWVIILGYAVNFVVTWALMASFVGSFYDWFQKEEELREAEDSSHRR